MIVMTMPTILTGIRSNEMPTLGNYLGAFLPMVELQKEYGDTYRIHMFVPDLHSITTPTDYDSLYQQSLTNLKYFIAAGLDLDHENTFIYRQSYIPAHSELTWILDCFTYTGELNRMTQFKDKGGDGHNATAGLYNYPVMMAADILLYHAEWVPVGEDQFQHLEITRDIAQRMNAKFGPLFTIPRPSSQQIEFMQMERGIRIRDLTDPTKKMSKSSENEKSKILLSDRPEIAAGKIMSATTDSLNQIRFDWDGQPGVTNLLQILALLQGRQQSEINHDWIGRKNYGELKRAVASVVADFLSDFRLRYEAIDEQKLLSKLTASETAVAEIANATLYEVQKAVGLRPRD